MTTLATLDALYLSAGEALAQHNFELFREVQLRISDCMLDLGDESGWILQLDWKVHRIGDKARHRELNNRAKANHWIPPSLLAPDFDRDTLVFDVPIPDEIPTPTIERETKQRNTSCRWSLLRWNNYARQNCNRTRFAGFEKYGLRFLGLHPKNTRLLRFTWVNCRAKRKRFYGKHAEDVILGGYLSLFYPDETLFVWRDLLGGYEAYKKTDAQPLLFA